MIQKPPFSSTPVQLEETDPAREFNALTVTERTRALVVQKSRFSEEEARLEEEALSNAVIEIEALSRMAAQAANERAEKERLVRSEIEALCRTPEQQIEELDKPADVIRHLDSDSSSERSLGLNDLARLEGQDAFHTIARAFDEQSEDVRNAAARALFDFQPDRAASFARTLREGSPGRRRRIGAALAGSGLAGIAIGNLAGQTREKGYEAFSLLFLMAKAGEVQPLVRAVEDHPNIEVRLAVVKLLALNGQAEIVPSFRQLAVRAVLPSEVRAAVIEAIYELGRQIQPGSLRRREG